MFQYVWVHCYPVAPYDAEHIGEISYYPNRAFYGQYFPYNGDRDYLPPLVAVQVDRHDSKFLHMRASFLWN